MSIRIFIMTHKRFHVPADKLYQPLQVGRAAAEDLGYWCDNTGENISGKNCYYSELTGFYWLWKNYGADDYIGTCHYRRYLINGLEKVISEKEYLALLQKYDVITTRRVQLNNSYHDGFAANHNIQALDMTGEVIREKYPAYYDTFQRLVNGNETYFGNILVMRHTLFNEYCAWLFGIFFEVEKRIDLETDEDEYHKRVFGFISEFLLLVWITAKGLAAYECKVGMIGEKAETRELKARLADYFRRRNAEGARHCFLQTLKRRPDVMMEASDITGELRLAMQVIATAEQESMAGESCILEYECEFGRLMEYFGHLNGLVSCFYRGGQAEEGLRYFRKRPVSASAVRVAVLLLGLEETEAALLQQKIVDIISSNMKEKMIE